ncbi:MAG: hypothetical protein FJ308_19125 [Planctomycetes bacterium]|nr:hypothetical protein [Planctomycetota bacterium]
MKSLGVSLVRSHLSLRMDRFQAQTSFHEWGRKQGLASDPESAAEGIGRLRRQSDASPMALTDKKRKDLSDNNLLVLQELLWVKQKIIWPQ